MGSNEKIDIYMWNTFDNITLKIRLQYCCNYFFFNHKIEQIILSTIFLNIVINLSIGIQFRLLHLNHLTELLLIQMLKCNFSYY